MRATDAQVRKLMDEMRRHGKVKLSGLRAGMSRNTAAKYVDLDRLPSELTEFESVSSENRQTLDIDSEERYITLD